MRELLWVYLGRSSGLIVNLVFLPLYSHLLGPDAFGVVALLLSLSGMLAVLDMGTMQRATNAMADRSRPAAEQLSLLATLDRSLTLTALAMTLLTLAATATLGSSAAAVTSILAAGFLWTQWRLNLQLAALQAMGDVRFAAALSLGGLTGRAVASSLVLCWPGAGVDAFLLMQGAITLSIVSCCRNRLRVLLPEDARRARRATWKGALTHLLDSRALVWTGVVGAISTQADKALISTLMSPAELSPYFLATTLAGAPLSILGAPLAQLVQIRFARQLSSQDKLGYRATWRFGLAAAGLLVVLPCALLAIAADPISHQWLHESEMAERVAHYARLLLIGQSVAALGYIPYAAVMAHADFSFQARLSTAAMVLQLAGFAIAASLQQIEGLCWTWAVYFAFCTLGLVLRSRHLDR